MEQTQGEIKMQSPCIREATKACFNGCCSTSPFLSLSEPPNTSSNRRSNGGSTPHHHFAVATAFSLSPNTQYTNHESLPPLTESFSNFNKAFPQYSLTHQADQIRCQNYSNLSINNHVCLDYNGHGLFSFSPQQINQNFFNISYKSVNLTTQILLGSRESEFESVIRTRIMSFMKISEEDYSMVFYTNQSSAFKSLADSYPFESNKNLLTVYDYENKELGPMIERSKKRGAKVNSAQFSWPDMSIHTKKLSKVINKNKGMFVFPLQSKVSGATYSYSFMSIARENGWHVLLDASGLGAKDMETLGLSLFQPDFLVCSFFKIFGENPSGFCCLFVKKSVGSVLNNSTSAMGIVSVVPAKTSSQLLRDQSTSSSETFGLQEIEEENLSVEGNNIEFSGLDDADSLGLILISSRVRYLVNWLVNALMSLHHPHSENGLPLVRIYGPKVRIDRGPAVAFNVFDWKGEKIDPKLVQKLADRHNISLSYGVLSHILFLDRDTEERERLVETTRASEEKLMNKRERVDLCVPVVTVSLGFLTNFEDVYKVWGFVSRFLDADFVEKERWRYMALNQTTVEV